MMECIHILSLHQTFTCFYNLNIEINRFQKLNHHVSTKYECQTSKMFVSWSESESFDLIEIDDLREDCLDSAIVSGVSVLISESSFLGIKHVFVWNKI